MKVAIEEVEAGAAVGFTAEKNHIYVSMFRKRVMHNRGLILISKQGHNQKIPLETDKKSATYMRCMAKLGFGPTKQELVGILSDYIEANEVSHHFNNKGSGHDWVQYFMKTYTKECWSYAGC